MYPIMTLSSFVRELYRSASALKGHFLGHALSSFQRSLPLPNPDLDALDSFRLPSVDDLSSQGNGDFNSSHPLCQARQSLTRPATFRCPRRRLFWPSQVHPKREEHWMRQSRRRCPCFRNEPRRIWPMKQPLSLT